MQARVQLFQALAHAAGQPGYGQLQAALGQLCDASAYLTPESAEAHIAQYAHQYRYRWKANLYMYIRARISEGVEETLRRACRHEPVCACMFRQTPVTTNTSCTPASHALRSLADQLGLVGDAAAQQAAQADASAQAREFDAHMSKGEGVKEAGWDSNSGIRE